MNKSPSGCLRIGPAILTALLIGCATTGSVPPPLPEGRPGPEPARPEPTRPNLLLILVDDLGYADAGTQGSTEVRTPNLDALARGGIQCTDAYVSAPQCFPSRAALMTGRYAQRFGIEHNASVEGCVLPLDVPTLAERLRSAGYATGLIGKWNLGEDDAHDPLSRGFDEFFGFRAFAHRYVRNDRFKPDEADPLRRGREPVLESEYLTDAFAREAVAFVARHAGEPFFLFASFNAPHTPLQPTPVHRRLVAGVPDSTRARYVGLILSLDEAVGALRRALREHDLERNTLILFLGDNGGEPWRGACNDPLEGGKGSLWEGGIRVPWVARWDGRLPGGRLDRRPVIQLDIVPTALAAARVAAAAEALDGIDLLGLWSDAARSSPRDVLYWRFFGGEDMAATRAWAIREGRWKLALPVWTAGAPRLFDLQEDPSEKHDLGAEHPALVERLEARWQAWADSLPPPRGVDQGRPDDEEE